MKVKQLNSSSRKTNKKIKEAFAELLKEKKDLNNITVTELVKKADITRSAFYTHFDSVYDVAQDFQNEALDLLMTNMKVIKSEEEFDYYLDIIFNYLQENEKIYAMMLSSDTPLLFVARLGRYINKHLQEAINPNKQRDLNIRITFFADGCMSLIIKYFRNELGYSLNELKDFIKTTYRSMLRDRK